jgi:hypothetical protein
MMHRIRIDEKAVPAARERCDTILTAMKTQIPSIIIDLDRGDKLHAQ